MQYSVSRHRQQYLYLAITLIVLGSAIALVIWQERGQKKIADETLTHQMIVLASDKIGKELVRLHTHMTSRTLVTEAWDGDGFGSGSVKNLYGTPFNLSVSLYRLQSHFGTITRLLKNKNPRHRLLEKLGSQIDQLLAMRTSLEATEYGDIQPLSRLLQGLMLSADQLGILYDQGFWELSEKLNARIERDNLILISCLIILGLFSYLLIHLTSHLTVTTQEKFAAELENKNAELERFVYTVSHDLRSPLVSIKGFVGMLQTDIALDNEDRIRADLKHINQAADDMGNLLEGLLELSRIGHVVNPPESGSLTDLVYKSSESIQEKIGRRGVTLEIEDNMPSYWGDQLRLTEVFQNLIENAVKFMGDQSNPRIEVSARQIGREIVCLVKDNGIGIDPRHHGRVFNLFECLNPNIEGTGIGMALVKRIIEAHGGTIRVESEGKLLGSTFIFTLPVKPDTGS